MTTNLRLNIVLIMCVLSVIALLMAAPLSLKKTPIYLDNQNNLFGRSEVQLTVNDKALFCDISNFDKCDRMIYRGNEYIFKGLDSDDAPFFNEIWSKERNAFYASPVEFGELHGQNEKLDDFIMFMIVLSGLLAAFASVFLLMYILGKSFERSSK